MQRPLVVRGDPTPLVAGWLRVTALSFILCANDLDG